MCEIASRCLGLSNSVRLCVNSQLGQRLGHKEWTGRLQSLLAVCVRVSDLPVSE